MLDTKKIVVGGEVFEWNGEGPPPLSTDMLEVCKFRQSASEERAWFRIVPNQVADTMLVLAVGATPEGDFLAAPTLSQLTENGRPETAQNIDLLVLRNFDDLQYLWYALTHEGITDHLINSK